MTLEDLSCVVDSKIGDVVGNTGVNIELVAAGFVLAGIAADFVNTVVLVVEDLGYEGKLLRCGCVGNPWLLGGGEELGLSNG